MNNCGVIIALCTAEDQWKRDNTTHPRQNVMLEIGLAIGLWRGPERCIIRQQWGSGVDQQAVLPSDLGGLLTLRFETGVKECWNELRDRLKVLGAHTNDPQADRRSGS